MRALVDIIDAAGGPRGIEAASRGAIRREAVYKWPLIGIPDRHWEVLIPLAQTSAEELYRANLVARQTDPNIIGDDRPSIVAGTVGPAVTPPAAGPREALR